MAYKFQLGKMTTLSNGSIVMVDGNFTATNSGDTADVQCAHLLAESDGGTDGSLIAAGDLTITNAAEGVSIAGAVGTSGNPSGLYVKGTMNDEHQPVGIMATGSGTPAHGALVVRRIGSGAGDGKEVILMGSALGNEVGSIAAGEGYLRMKNSANNAVITFDGENGDAAMGKLNISNTAANARYQVSGNLAITGDLTVGGTGEVVQVDSTNLAVNAVSATFNSDYNGTTFNNNQDKGGVLYHGAALFQLKREDLARPGGTDSGVKAIQFRNAGDSATLSLEASVFEGDGSKLSNVDSNGNSYSSTLSLFTGAGTAVKNVLNICHGGSGDYAITLPKADTMIKGDVIKIINLRHDTTSTANRVVITPNGADQIDQATDGTTLNLISNEASITLMVLDNASNGVFGII